MRDQKLAGSLPSWAVGKMGVVEQAPKFLIGFELGLLMGCRLDHVLEVVVVDQGRELGHHCIHLLRGVEIHAIRVVTVSVFMHHGTLGQVWRDEFGETLEVVLVAATNVENCWSLRVEMGGFFSDRIEADFGENPHAENVSLFGRIESLLRPIMPNSAGISGDMSNTHFTFGKALTFCACSQLFSDTFSP